MLSECERAIEYELDRQRLLKKRFAKRVKALEDLPRGALLAMVQKNKVRYFLSVLEDGERKRIYLNKEDTELRELLQERYYLERALPTCQKNIEMLELLQNSYSSLDPIDLMKDAPIAYQKQNNAAQLVYGCSNKSRWKEKMLKHKEKYEIPFPSELRHISGDGTVTRSKSEALIIDLLNNKDIPYVYDYPMYLSNKLKWPDFVIWDRKHNREVIIEHLGLMSKEDYRLSQIEKLWLYIENGYVPNVNLLLTFDDKSGNINIPAISKSLEAILS